MSLKCPVWFTWISAANFMTIYFKLVRLSNLKRHKGQIHGHQQCHVKIKKVWTKHGSHSRHISWQIIEPQVFYFPKKVLLLVSQVNLHDVPKQTTATNVLGFFSAMTLRLKALAARILCASDISRYRRLWWLDVLCGIDPYPECVGRKDRWQESDTWTKKRKYIVLIIVHQNSCAIAQNTCWVYLRLHVLNYCLHLKMRPWATFSPDKILMRLLIKFEHELISVLSATGWQSVKTH